MQRLALVTIVALAACAGGRSSTRPTSPPEVADADLGRLGPDQMQPVDDARRFLSSARDELARARLRLEQTQQEDELARADAQVATAEATRAAAQARIADGSREPAQLELARELHERARLAKAAADARTDWARKLVEARRMGVQAAERQVDLGEARLEWSKLQALQLASIPAAGKYDGARFQARVAEAQRTFDGALQRARELDGQQTVAQRRWQDLQRVLQARGTAAVPVG
jgi:hypothetical protein